MVREERNTIYLSLSFQLVEAYATMIECCQLFDFKNLANHYLEKAMSQ